AAAVGGCCVPEGSVRFNKWTCSAPVDLVPVVSLAVSSAQRHHTESWSSSADILREPDVQHIVWDEFNLADEAIAAGAAAARAALPRLRQLLRLPEKTKPAAPDCPTSEPGWNEGTAR